MKHRVEFIDKSAKMIRERVDSREWWIWIPVGPTGAKMLQRIEKAFYWNEANKDFDLAWFPTRGLFVALGNKSRATAEQLRTVMEGRQQKALTEQTDVIVLIAENEPVGTGDKHLRAFAELLVPPYYPDLN